MIAERRRSPLASGVKRRGSSPPSPVFERPPRRFIAIASVSWASRRDRAERHRAGREAPDDLLRRLDLVERDRLACPSRKRSRPRSVARRAASSLTRLAYSSYFVQASPQVSAGPAPLAGASLGPPGRAPRAARARSSPGSTCGARRRGARRRCRRRAAAGRPCGPARPRRGRGGRAPPARARRRRCRRSARRSR